MATYNQISSLPIVGADVPLKNYSTSLDIPAGTGVIFDTVNKGDAMNAAGIIAPTSAGGVAGTAGITIELIRAGHTGRVRMLGGAVGVANATLNPGDLVQLSDVTAHLGEIIAAASTTRTVGMAMSAAVAGDPILVWVNVTGHN